MEDRLNRLHWLEAGLAQLADEGPKGLRIMAIAQRLGVTKGSFYWHFDDLNAYREALLAQWEEGYTQQIIDQIEGMDGDAAFKLRHLMWLGATADARLALAIRSWAAADPRAAKVLKRVDKKRLLYLAGLLEGLGWPPHDASTLARWVHCALIGHFSMQEPALTQAQVELLFGTLAVRVVAT